jgi:dynein heavy chain
LKELESGLLK